MHHKGIEKGFLDGIRNEIISRKIYLSFPTSVFIGKEEEEYEIRNAISIFFKIPIYSVQVAGSSKTGFSYYQNQPFITGESDLDVAVVDSELYRKYTEIVYNKTKGLKDLSNFGRTKSGIAHSEIYKSSILKGIFRPDAMPSCDERKEWFKFFNKLSEKHVELFKDINCGIYFSQTFFEFKQADNMDIYKELKQYGKI